MIATRGTCKSCLQVGETGIVEQPLSSFGVKVAFTLPNKTSFPYSLDEIKPLLDDFGSG
jgi:hypothetical protein